MSQFVMPTKAEATQQCKGLLEAFFQELGIPMPMVAFDRLWYGLSVFDVAASKYRGHRLYVQSVFRHTEDTGFQWDQNTPNWRETWQNHIEITYKYNETEHECPYCECSLAITEKVGSKEQAIAFARRIRG